MELKYLAALHKKFLVQFVQFRAAFSKEVIASVSNVTLKTFSSIKLRL